LADRLLEQKLFARKAEVNHGETTQLCVLCVVRCGAGILSRAARDVNDGAPAQMQRVRGAGAVGRDLEMIRAAEEGGNITRGDVAVRGYDPGNMMQSRHDVQPGSAQPVERVSIDVRDEVAKAVDAHDTPRNRV